MAPIIRAMAFLGDLGGGLLAALYDYRFAVAIASVVLLFVLVLAGRRYRWTERIRRHPMAAGLAGIVALIVLAPVTWYLVSPIFIRTELVEAPIAAAAPSPSSAAASPSASSASASTSPDPSATAPAEPTATPWSAAAPRSGSFTGTDDFHFGKGTATLSETAPGKWTIRLADFSVRNGPDLFVYLSPDGNDYADGAIEIAKLKATDGSFNVAIPAGTDPASARSVLIWCKQFAHLFAYATLES
ncbi:MAG: DM13 domain-containing protein [Candidatus Limnocylindrales bacterium]